MYQWGTETDYGKEGACATVISLKKGSELSVKLLEELKLSKNAHGTWWGKELFASLWSKWPHYKIFPGSFFNTEWMMDKYAELYNEDFGLYNKVTSSWFSNPLESHEHLFLDAFTWHWHNTSHKKDPIVSNNPSVKVGKTLSGKIDFSKNKKNGLSVKSGQQVSGKVTKSN